jgi:CheY-like chemotaxis protein/Tfp pilus assembly protein PilZ
MGNDLRNRVLIVDDEPDLREIIAFDFEAAGYVVDCAEDGLTAWKALSESKYDVVVSDIRMPNSDGVSLLKKVKSGGRGDVPVMVFITGYSDLSLDEAYHLGIDGFFSKPFDRRELVQNIKRLLTPPLERWKESANSEKNICIKKTYKNIDTAMKDGDLALGRGGLFLALQDNSGPVGTKVQLDLDFGESKIKGTGFIRWVRPKTTSTYKAGVGIEFLTLDSSSLQIINDLMEKMFSQNNSQAFIPRG